MDRRRTHRKREGDDGQPRLPALSAEQRRLVSENLGLVAVHLKRFLGGRSGRVQRRSWNDLFQEGCLGLIRAAVDFRPNRAIPFASFALPRIRTVIRKAVLAEDREPRERVIVNRDGVPLDRRAAGFTRHDPFRPPRRSGQHPARRLDAPPTRLEGPDETLGDRLRAKYERAVRCAADAERARRRRRDDGEAVLRMLADERLLIPDEDARRSLRRIAHETRFAYSWIVQCDRRLVGAIRRGLRRDPEFEELRRLARGDPLGVDAPLDREAEKRLARVGADGLFERLRGAGDGKPGPLVHDLRQRIRGAVESAIAAEFERLTEAQRERRREEFEADVRRSGDAASPGCARIVLR